ncbi:MAG: hypothetical protein ACXWFH_11365 [Solirubrobacterales bacterium]
MNRHKALRGLLIFALVALTAGLIACGGGDSDGGDGETEVSFDDAQVEFAQCMRENGVEDFQDPTGEGPGAGGGFADVDTDSPEFEAASEECGSIIQDAIPEGEMPDQAEMQDQLLELTQCLRDKGFDVPDVQFGSPGSGGPPEGAEEMQDLQDDPEFQDATEQCQDETGFEPPNPGGQ